jgi:aryl-alcohol dehydrogenase-like predicted oxidoreductase
MDRKTDAALDVVAGLETIAKKHNATIAQVALSWVRDREGVTSPIIGPRTMEQLEDNLGSADVVLDSADQDLVDGLVAPGSSVSEFYTADFGPHPHRV